MYSVLCSQLKDAGELKRHSTKMTQVLIAKTKWTQPWKYTGNKIKQQQAT